jgi:hypothetical protein
MYLVCFVGKIVWNVDLLLGIDDKMSSYATVVIWQLSVNRNGRAIHSVRSVLSCYKHEEF